MAKPVRVLGAGLSGLSLAVNLARNDVPVIVFEKRSSVGLQIHPNFQVLHSGGSTPEGYLKTLNLKPAFRRVSLGKVFFSARSRDLDLNLKHNIHFIQRGGRDSLEYGLYRQAVGLGVEFKFNQILPESEVRVVATGPKRVDAAGYGEVYETDAFDVEHFFMMYDDRYSPKGWYLYAVPYDGRLAIMNCACQPYVGLLKPHLKKALAENKILKEAVAGKKPVGFMGGYGNVSIPKTAVIDGRVYLGEAAGFQDPFRGFGMEFALESGKMAADAIINNLDYDRLWKDEFMPQFKLDYSRRFFISLFGSRIVDLVYSRVKSGDTISFIRGDFPGFAGDALKTVFLNAELLKYRLTGRW
jgi:digeranylgeranylglycerophospholipid reductase